MNIRHPFSSRFRRDTMFLTMEGDYLAGWSFSILLFLSFFSFCCCYIAVFLLEILLERSPYRMPFSFHSYERDIFLLCHSLEKLRIIIIIIIFFHFVCSNKSFYLLIVTCTNFSQIFLDPNSSSCFWACFIPFVFLADVSCKFSSTTVPTGDSR